MQERPFIIIHPFIHRSSSSSSSFSSSSNGRHEVEVVLVLNGVFEAADESCVHDGEDVALLHDARNALRLLRLPLPNLLHCVQLAAICFPHSCDLRERAKGRETEKKEEREAKERRQGQEERKMKRKRRESGKERKKRNCKHKTTALPDLIHRVQLPAVRLSHSRVRRGKQHDRAETIPMLPPSSCSW